MARNGRELKKPKQEKKAPVPVASTVIPSSKKTAAPPASGQKK